MTFQDLERMYGLILRLRKFPILIKMILISWLHQLHLCKYPKGLNPKREFHEFYLPISQVFDKLKTKGLLKPLDPRPIPNPLPSKFDVNKRCAYHQILGHDTDRCFTLHHAIQDLIKNKVIAPPTRPSITNNPFPNHNFGKGSRVNCLMTEEENKENLSSLIYDLPECFMMTWEELMDKTSTTTIGYDIWNEVPK